MAAIARTTTATPTPMPAEAPLDRPLEDDDEATAVLAGEAVADADDVESCACDAEPVAVVADEAVVEVAGVDVAAAAMPVENALSLICVMDWKDHATPSSELLLVNVTLLSLLSNR